MKIEQCHISNMVSHFSLQKTFGLLDYTDQHAPLVMFALSDERDLRTLARHHGPIYIVWMSTSGDKEALKQPYLDKFTRNVFVRRRLLKAQTDWIVQVHQIFKTKKDLHHVTWLPSVFREFKRRNIPCSLLKIPLDFPRPTTQKLGRQMYSYIHYQAEAKAFLFDVMATLQVPHPLVLGRGTVDYSAWNGGVSDQFYSDVFIGLFLNKRQRGAGGIIELGLRGIKVVTNVLDLPNCIPWDTKEDIENAIKIESKKIGTMDVALSEQVYACLAKEDDLHGFNLEKLQLC